MAPEQPTRCGEWPSPLSPERAAAGAVVLSGVANARGQLHWLEGRPAEKGRRVLVRLAADGQVSEVLTPDADINTRVHEYGGRAWAEVGTRLLYAQDKDQQLRVVQPGGAMSLLTPQGCRYADFHAAPDGHTVVAVREDHRASGEAVNSVVRLDTRCAEDEGQVLYGQSDFVAWPRLNADGTRLALVAWDHPAMPWDGTRLLVGDMASVANAANLANTLDAAATPWQQVAGGVDDAVMEPQWGADGSLYFLSDRNGWWNLYRWADGSCQALTSFTDAEVGGPLWQLGASAYVLLDAGPGPGRVLLRVSRNTVDQLVLLDVPTGVLTPLALPFVLFGALGLLRPGVVHAVAVAVDDVQVLITVDTASGQYRVLRRAGNAPLPPEAVSRAVAVDFPTQPGADGQPRRAQAWFYAPRLPGSRVPTGEAPPLIVTLHGGPTAHSVPVFKASVQFWTSRGFAVVDVNYGGSSGFGRDYRNRLRGQWGVVDLQDAVAAVDELVARGWADGQRVAIRGGSAGGFSVLCGLAFTTRFAAGINYFGVADLQALASDTHKFESRYLDSLVAPLPEGRAVYQQRSPVLHMNRCRAALLTLQGSEDKAVPPQQSRAIVDAARAAGCPVAYVEFEGEGHGFRQSANLVRALQLELAFLGRVFGFTPADPVPAIEIDNASALA